MQALNTPAASCDDERRDLEYLLEAFSSMVSLKDIASAYCQAKCNVEMAGEILCRSHLTSSNGASSSKVKLEGASATSLEGPESGRDFASAVHAGVSTAKSIQNPFNGMDNTRALKSKKLSASVGTVSGMIGKEYSRPRASTIEYTEVKKPLKLDWKEVPASAIWSEEVQSTTPPTNSKLQADAEEFLCKMLGEGFKLDMNVIREVLGLCGYDVQKSMENLLFMSASTLEKSDDVVGLAGLKSAEKRPDQHSAHSDLSESPVGEGDGLLSQQVLQALFHVPERTDEAPKRSLPSREVKRYKYKGLKGYVVKPFIDTVVECKATVALAPQGVSGPDGDDDNGYEVLRKSVKEFILYYKAAFNAFCEGDRARSDKLLEKGHYFNKMAREADEKSAQMLIQAQSSEDDVSLDLQNHEPKEATRLLRSQLTYLSGIPAFKYLRVIVGLNDEDTTGGARRRLIVKLLEKESIKWTEEENGRTISIRVDEIDPKSLSFSKK
ncbi:putative nuclear RNA export factor SDE5 [Malus sylvestris]|uniref:putative nuclear RNA export factor SDE5 n=1 Tax=Malus sylvestris TaxID=3752 RepID=UPI0021AC12D5|nr:putative nuclear RNA export factor SDE5 [Malus sylvestris]